MNNHIKNIIAYSEGHLIGNNRNRFEKELQNNEELSHDYYLFKRMNESMRGRVDLEEVRNDPDLNDMVPFVKELITNYYQNPENYRDKQHFVIDSLRKRETDVKLTEEISQIKKEILEYKVNELAENWVNKWNEKDKSIETENPVRKINRDFITRSLEPENAQSDLIMSRKKKNDKRKYMIRITGLAAAALITIFVVIKALIPSSDPEKLYKAYYEPFNIISPVTRSNNVQISNQFVQAIGMYKQGKYQEASAGFSDIIQKDASLTAPFFFGGITQMELGHYSSAITLLSEVIEQSQEYGKEAQWYLGLSYLKTSDKTKAIGYFENLAVSEGYYQTLAKKLLRRLK
jgi:tetratricopeptide (TPR) repeat protein